MLLGFLCGSHREGMVREPQLGFLSSVKKFVDVVSFHYRRGGKKWGVGNACKHVGGGGRDDGGILDRNALRDQGTDRMAHRRGLMGYRL
jgi:hypothetical protein